jgi:transcriptional regulator with XRE-family HTH domain
MLLVMENVRHKHLEWVQGILDAKHWNRTQLARISGVDPSTLTKFWNDSTGTARLNTYTIEKIEAASGIRAFETSPAPATRGLAEREAEPYVADPAMASSGAFLSSVRQNQNGIDPWVLKSRALELAGYLPGDVLVVDLNSEPRSGDVVCAQVYDRRGHAETVFRIYEHPYLVACSMDMLLQRPLLVDGDHAQIRGVVTASFRQRRAAA